MSDERAMIDSEATTAGRQSVEGEYKPRVGERVRILMGDHYDEFGTVLEPANGHGLYAIRLDSGHSIKAKPGYFERSLQAEFGNPYLTKVVRGMNRTCECGEQYELRPICAGCEKRVRRQLAEAQERAERAIDKRVLALNERVKQARAMIAEERKRAELAEAHNAQLRKVLERVRNICAMSRKVSIGGINTHHAVHVRVGLVEEMTTALASAPANPIAAVVEAARALAVTLYQHNEAAIKRFHIEVLGREGEIGDDEGDCCEICCEVSDLLYDLGQKLGEIGIDDLSKIPDIRDLAKLPSPDRMEAIRRLNQGEGIEATLADLGQEECGSDD